MVSRAASISVPLAFEPHNRASTVNATVGSWPSDSNMSGPPEAQLIHALSKFHCLLHELYLTNHHSSQEHAIYGTSCLLLAFLSPTTCHLSNLRSINLILTLSPLRCSLFAFFFLPLLGHCIGHHGLSST